MEQHVGSQRKRALRTGRCRADVKQRRVAGIEQIYTHRNYNRIRKMGEALERAYVIEDMREKTAWLAIARISVDAGSPASRRRAQRRGCRLKVLRIPPFCSP